MTETYETQQSTDVVLLAIDIGLRSGLAGFNAQGDLVSYCSKHFSNRKALKQAAYSICNEYPFLQALAIEGGGDHAVPWVNEANRRELTLFQTSAEEWRRDLLFKREQRSGKQAKHHAIKLAKDIIADAGLKGPTSLRHDAAEAITMGYWAVSKLMKRTS